MKEVAGHFSFLDSPLNTPESWVPKMPGKPWYTSKTTWVAILTTLAGVIGSVMGQEWIKDHPDVVSYLTVALGILMAILRGITSKPITLESPNKLLALGGVLFLASSANADAIGSKSADLRGFAPSSTYVIQITTDADGKIAGIERISPSPVVDVSTLPIVTDGGDPPSPPPSGLRSRATTLAQSLNDPDTARNIAVAYTVVLLRAAAGDYSTVEEFGKAQQDARKGVLGDQALISKWSPFEDLQITEVRAALNEGRLDSVDEYATLLTDIRDGLLVAAGNSASEFNIMGVLPLVLSILESIGNDGLSWRTILEIVISVMEVLGGS